MLKTEVEQIPGAELTEEMVREQLELLVQDPVFRSSKRSIEFLRYVVDRTLKGAADQIKERTIGIEVFGRTLTYDTNVDHVVRTAANELRKRLAIYYGEEKHRFELRMSLVPGSYVPHFSLPAQSLPADPEIGIADTVIADPPLLAAEPLLPQEPPPAEPPSARQRPWVLGGALLLFLAAILLYTRFHHLPEQELFWRPLLDAPGPVLLAVGDVPDGPPTVSPFGVSEEEGKDGPLPTVHTAASSNVPFADMVTIARIVGLLQAHGKKTLIRSENASSFSDLREGPVVLVGAFNNEWSLRLTHRLRYSLALDADNHLVYIKDQKAPASRAWSWRTDQSREHHHGASAPVLHDYALISRIWNSDTGHVLIAVGGLYTYGTQAAGEFLTDPQLMQTLSSSIPPEAAHRNVQIVLGTDVTDETPGPPRVLAVSVE